MAWWHWLLLIGGNTPAYIWIARLLFPSRRELARALRYAVSPEEWTLLKGQGVTDWRLETAPALWLLACTLLVTVEALLIESIAA